MYSILLPNIRIWDIFSQFDNSILFFCNAQYWNINRTSLISVQFTRQ